MDKEKPNRLTKSSQEGYVIMPNNFLTEWVKALGKGPVLLYLQLLTYCHKEKDIAWPALSTLGNHLDMSKNSLISYQKTLLKYGLIKKSAGRRSTQGNYRSNLYKVTPIKSPKIIPGQVQKLDTESPKFALDQAQNLHPNNNNINNTNTTTKEGKDAVVDFKKLKEKGDLSACLPERGRSQSGNAQAEEKMQSIREQLRDLDFEWKFIEQILKDYPPRKIEEKLDLLMERRNIQSPAGWLVAALKNDYQYVEQPSRITPHPHLGPPPSRGRKFNIIANDHRERGNLVSTPEQVSREKALEAIRLIQKNISNCTSVRKDPYPLSPGGRGLG